MTKLQQLAENGIDRQLLEASINLMEFRLREADFGSAPKGLIYGIRIMKSWLYGGAPETYLRYEDLLQQMKAGLSSRYFESLIEEYFLANPHRSCSRWCRTRRWPRAARRSSRKSSPRRRHR